MSSMRAKYTIRYQVFASESFNSNTPAPMDYMGRTVNFAGRPFCISRNELPKSHWIGFGHDFNTFHESPSHEIEAMRFLSVGGTFFIV